MMIRYRIPRCCDDSEPYRSMEQMLCSLLIHRGLSHLVLGTFTPFFFWPLRRELWKMGIEDLRYSSILAVRIFENTPVLYTSADDIVTYDKYMYKYPCRRLGEVDEVAARSENQRIFGALDPNIINDNYASTR